MAEAARQGLKFDIDAYIFDAILLSKWLRLPDRN